MVDKSNRNIPATVNFGIYWKIVGLTMRYTRNDGINQTWLAGKSPR